MKWSNCGILLVGVILLCFGQLIESSDKPKPVPRCHQPDILYSYLQDAIIHYNRSYPYVDPTAVLSPVLELMLETGDSGYSETNQDLMTFWILVCWAEDIDQENEAWKVLAREITHRLQTDQSVYQISTLLFGDRMAGWLMDPRLENLELGDLNAVKACVRELTRHHTNYCGPLFAYGFKYSTTFDAMCMFGLKGDEYADAAQEVCKDYVYISHPLRELS